MSPPVIQSYPFRVPEGKRLASLAGMEIDLQAVVGLCDRLDEANDISRLDFPLWEALSAAAVVRYGRCFKQGVRGYLSEKDMLAAPAELQETHRFIIHLRDKHIAHSVNPFEENEVMVMIGDHFESSDEIVGVSTAHGRTIGLSFDEPERLRALCRWWLEWVGQESALERERLVAIARTHQLDQLKRVPPHVLGGDTGPHNVAKTRKRP